MLLYSDKKILKKVGFQIDFAWTDLKNENICKLKLKCDEKKRDLNKKKKYDAIFLVHTEGACLLLVKM